MAPEARAADIARMAASFTALKQRRDTLVAMWRIAITEIDVRHGKGVNLKSADAPADVHRWECELQAVEDQIRELRKQMLTHRRSL